jgi:hypothetical protein
MERPEDWPNVSDPRLLAILREQVAGSLHDLRLCSEDGLDHLAKIIESHPHDALTTHVLSALTDLQRIDRVMQRLQNVISSLDEWEKSCDHARLDDPAWLEHLIQRYVMPEEREVVTRALSHT